MKKTVAWVALAWAIVLSITSLIMPPMGEIHNSVLILIAQIIVFICTLVGISVPENVKSLFNGTNSKKGI